MGRCKVPGRRHSVPLCQAPRDQPLKFAVVGGQDRDSSPSGVQNIYMRRQRIDAICVQNHGAVRTFQELADLTMVTPVITNSSTPWCRR